MLGWELPPHNSGGLGVACYHMSKALAAEGASIDFVVPYEAQHPDCEFMTVHASSKRPPGNPLGANGAYSSSPTNDTDDDQSLRGLQRAYGQYVEQLVAEKSPDAIHAHDWLTMEAGVRAKQLTGAPLIVHVHATEFDRSGEQYGNQLVHEIESVGLQMADRIIAVSQITKNLIVQRYHIPSEKIEVVHNAIDAAALDGHDYDQATYRYIEALKHEGHTVVATITRFTIQKGLTHLMKAAAKACEKYDRLVFLFVGDGEQRDELVALSAELGIADKVFFTGFVRGKQWRDAYQVADVFVMSSVSEPFGLTALEAAHYDCALVISKQSGVGEILHSIFRYDYWNIDALADQLVGIALSDALASSLRSGVKREYARLSWSDVAARCMELYRRLQPGGVS